MFCFSQRHLCSQQHGSLSHCLLAVKNFFKLNLMFTLLLLCVPSTSRDYNDGFRQCQGDLSLILDLLCLLTALARGTLAFLFGFIPYYKT